MQPQRMDYPQSEYQVSDHTWIEQGAPEMHWPAFVCSQIQSVKYMRLLCTLGAICWAALGFASSQ